MEHSPNSDWLDGVLGTAARPAMSAAERAKRYRRRRKQAREAGMVQPVPEVSALVDRVVEPEPLDVSAIEAGGGPERASPSGSEADAHSADDHARTARQTFAGGIGAPIVTAPAAPETATPPADDLGEDVGAIDSQLLSAAAQLSAVRSDIIRLRRAREAAEARHEAAQERHALRRFAEGAALGDRDFDRVLRAVRRDPRASVMTPAIRSAFYQALGAAQELVVLGIALDEVDGRLAPALLEGHSPTPKQQTDIRALLVEIDEAEDVVCGMPPQEGTEHGR